jgi:hypothetical protein
MLPVNIDIGKLAKPATVLIEKISSAIGILYEPKRIVNNAKAEAEARKIATLVNIEISELEKRALERFVHQEARKQENIEAITAEAITSLPNDADVSKLDEDWIAHFFNLCDKTSDSEMQTLWGRILSGEASKSGSFSKRTINLVSTLDKKDAELFTKLCQFVWMIGEPVPLIFDSTNPIYIDQNINFSTLNHLQTIGLVSFNNLSGFVRKSLPKQFSIFYYGQQINFECPMESNNELQLGRVIFTAAGKELVSICGSVPNSKFLDYSLENWQKENLIVSRVDPTQNFS